MALQQRSVCVFTASSEELPPRYSELAAELGRELAGRKMNLVSGGGAISTMGSVATSSRAHGAHTLGVIPRSMLDWEVADTEADELLVTDDMRERKALMDHHSDAFLALPGGIGTLEELFEAWVGRVLGMHRKPVVVVDPWNDYAHLQACLDHLAQVGFVRENSRDSLWWFQRVEDALDAIEQAWGAGEGRYATLSEPPPGRPPTRSASQNQAP